MNTRIELAKRGIKFTQQMIKKDMSSEKGLADGVSSYEEVKQELEKVLVHLQNLSSPELQRETGCVDEVSYLFWITLL